MNKLSLILALCSTLLLSSCAYTQVHKNVKQRGNFYKGFEADIPTNIYQSNGKWYIKGQKFKLRLKYPTIYDTVFLESGAPELVRVGDSLGVAYQEISSGTAIALRERNGYATLPLLQREMQELRTTPRDSLNNNATRHEIRAEIAQTHKPLRVTYAEASNRYSLATKSLSYLTFAAVDVPATLAYNVSIPFMAPFYFFYDSYSEFTKDPFE